MQAILNKPAVFGVAVIDLHVCISYGILSGMPVIDASAH